MARISPSMRTRHRYDKDAGTGVVILQHRERVGAGVSHRASGASRVSMMLAWLSRSLMIDRYATKAGSRRCWLRSRSER
jgi:hypothetical protein